MKNTLVLLQQNRNKNDKKANINFKQRSISRECVTSINFVLSNYFEKGAQIQSLRRFYNKSYCFRHHQIIYKSLSIAFSLQKVLKVWLLDATRKKRYDKVQQAFIRLLTEWHCLYILRDSSTFQSSQDMKTEL